MSKPRDPSGNDWIVASTALAMWVGKAENREDIRELSDEIHHVILRWIKKNK